MLHSDFSEQIFFELWRPCGFYIIELTQKFGFLACLYYVVMGDFLCPAHFKTPTVETVSLVSFSRPTVYHGRRCIYFLREVKGSKGGEKWRGSLKVRAGFLRCSGGHPATSPGSVYLSISELVQAEDGGKGSDRQSKQTDNDRERQNTALKEWEENILSIQLLFACCRAPETLAAAVCNSVVRSLADLTVEAITVMLLQA